MVTWGTGCQGWHTEPAAPAQVLAVRQPSTLRITRSDGSEVVLEQPALRGDTLVGMVRYNSSHSETQIPLADVRTVAIRHFSAWRTVALGACVAGPVTFALITIKWLRAMSER